MNRKIWVCLIITVLLTVIGVSFGYYTFAVQETGSGSLGVGTDTAINLTFNVSKQIGFTLTQFNLVQNGEDIIDSSVASATIAGGTNASPVTGHYYVYLNIASNTFIYTTEAHTPELLLKVLDPSGNEVTSITGLTYNSTYRGFDITTKSGLIPIALNRSITSRSVTTSTTESWTIAVMVNNLDSNQADNEGATFNSSILIRPTSYSS